MWEATDREAWPLNDPHESREAESWWKKKKKKKKKKKRKKQNKSKRKKKQKKKKQQKQKKKKTVDIFETLIILLWLEGFTLHNIIV